MSSIDDLFKKPLLPSQKRKLEPIRDPNQVYKSPKLHDGGDARSNASQQQQQQQQQPSVADDEDDEDMEAGPELPPGFDDDEGDDEGRFFGGGVSQQTADAMNYLDTADGEEGEEPLQEETIDVAWLRRMALNFEKKINKNAELRAKFETEPQKFMGSEADLDAEVKALSLLSEHPELYAEFAKLGCTGSLVGLLAHENTDIAIDAIEIVGELIDEDVQAEEEQWSALVDGLLEADLLSLLHSNLGRLKEDQEEDRTGVYNILAIIESLASRAALADKIGGDKNFFPWLISRARLKEARVSQNKQYATEVCAILLQASKTCRRRFIDDGCIDEFLQLLSAFRKRDPQRGMEEEEYMENLFDCLTCAVDEVAGKSKFLEAEGIELCLIMVREGKMSKSRALRLLDHALSGSDGRASCEAFVEAAGLKPLFTAFMKKQEGQSYEHMLGIFASLLRSLPADSAPRIRLLAKFVEKDYQKVTRLAELRTDYLFRLRRVEKVIDAERTALDTDEQAELEDEWLFRRLDAGLFAMQTTNTVLAWIAAEDEGARSKISSIVDLDNIRKSLEEQAVQADEDVKEMLLALVKAI